MNSEEKAVFRHIREELSEERKRRDYLISQYMDAKQRNCDLRTENGRLRQENEDLKRSLQFIAERRESNRDWAQAHNALTVWGRPKGAY